MILRIPFETSDWTSNKILSSSTSEAINAISIVLSSSKETRSRSTTTGASFIGFTVISNCWETTSVPSETFTVIKEFPYLLSNGSKFNVYVPLLNENTIQTLTKTVSVGIKNNAYDQIEVILKQCIKICVKI